MKIKKIEYFNFRNFKERGCIRFSTDGKVTIIYGKNGDGKTTLHQLFQWILYSQVHFNKTASDKMYNLEYEKELELDELFEVWGSIDFEHAGEEYSVRRQFTYKKGLDASSKVKEDFSIRKKDGDNDWGECLNKPEEVIEELLPSGLAEYFFFDGESMIADLGKKGKDSAGKLKDALYSIFNLEIYQNAIDHIGRTDLKTTVIGTLFKDMDDENSTGEVSVVKTNIDNAQNKIEEYEETKKKAQDIKHKNQQIIQEMSEKIGSVKSKAQYEAERKEAQVMRDLSLKQIEDAQVEFGDKIVSMFPKLLVHKKMQDARKYILKKAESQKLIPGVNRMLIDSLLHDEVECVCGRSIYAEQKERLKAYYRLLPPDSYKGLYDNFTKLTQLWGNNYSRETIEQIIKKLLDAKQAAQKFDKKIKEIDEAEKDGKNLQKAIEARQKAEDMVEQQEMIIADCKTQLYKYNSYLKKQMKEYEKLTEQSKKKAIRIEQINIMEKVREYFEEELRSRSVTYSKKLCSEIQTLINKMLTSRRVVSVTSDFFVKVFDSFGDESKSEGQFAIVSFAYIGGILRMLSKEEELSNKEYPLVLDGPFSKLDPDQRQNVIDTIPEYAPQVILFSKDDLQDCFGVDKIGTVWTIRSNEEKNVAYVEEGYTWTK